MEQIELVYDAFVEGARTSRDAAEVTGLPVKICSAMTSLLFKEGLLFRSKKMQSARRVDTGRLVRRKYYTYELPEYQGIHS